MFVLAERIVLKKLRRLFFGTEDGDGLFSPGGSMANMYGYTLARHRYFPDSKQKGLFGMPPLVLYTSQDVCLYEEIIYMFIIKLLQNCKDLFVNCYY